jgi:hypothetical protein
MNAQVFPLLSKVGEKTCNFVRNNFYDHLLSNLHEILEAIANRTTAGMVNQAA